MRGEELSLDATSDIPIENTFLSLISDCSFLRLLNLLFIAPE